MHSLLYNALISWTLFPILALHRWVMCTMGGTLSNVGGSTITVQFGDVRMDASWGSCSPSGCLSTGLFGGDSQTCVSDGVQSFVDFVVMLGSGVGETALYLMLLGWNSAMDVALSLVWGIQGVMFAFNLQACKVPDYTQVSKSCPLCSPLRHPLRPHDTLWPPPKAGALAIVQLRRHGVQHPALAGVGLGDVVHGRAGPRADGRDARAGVQPVLTRGGVRGRGADARVPAENL